MLVPRAPVERLQWVVVSGRYHFIKTDLMENEQLNMYMYMQSVPFLETRALFHKTSPRNNSM